MSSGVKEERSRLIKELSVALEQATSSIILLEHSVSSAVRLGDGFGSILRTWEVFSDSWGKTQTGENKQKNAHPNIEKLHD